MRNVERYLTKPTDTPPFNPDLPPGMTATTVPLLSFQPLDVLDQLLHEGYVLARSRFADNPAL